MLLPGVERCATSRQPRAFDPCALWGRLDSPLRNSSIDVESIVNNQQSVRRLRSSVQEMPSACCERGRREYIRQQDADGTFRTGLVHRGLV